MIMVNKERFSGAAGSAIKWCLFAVLFAAPFSKSISELSIALAIILWLIKKTADRDFRLAKTELNISLLVFVLAVVPSLFISAFPLLSIKAFFTKVLKFVLLYFVIVENIDTRSKLKDLCIVGFLSAVIILIDGLIQHGFVVTDPLHNYPLFKLRSEWDENGFFRGFPTASFPFPNDLSAWILLVLFPIACLAMFDLKRRKVRHLAGLVSLGLFYLFFLAKARAAWIGLAISTVYIALSKKKVWLIGLLILLVAVPFILKMEMAGYIFGASSMGDRASMWNTGAQIFKAHPIIGNGLNTFFVKFREYRNDKFKGLKGSYAHNCYLQMAADTGLIGLVSFLWLILSYFISIIKGIRGMDDGFHKSLVWGISIGVFAFLVQSFFDTNLYSLNLATLFWFAIGLSQSILKVSSIGTPCHD